MAKKAARGVAEAKTDSTHPLPELFAKDAATIGKTLASKNVPSKGPASGIRILTHFLNRGGKGLYEWPGENLKAKRLLSNRIEATRKTGRAM